MESFVLFGTLVNAVGVIVGGLLGVCVQRLLGKKSSHPRVDALTDAIFRGVALCVFAIGIAGMIKAAVNDQIAAALAGSYVSSPETPLVVVTQLVGDNILVVILCIVLGAAIGTLLDLDGAINRLGDRVEKFTKNRFGNVAQGFVSASLLFCVGSMAIVGSLNSGLSGDHTMLYTKSLLDMVAAFVFAATLGIGVVFSASLVFLYQGSITLLSNLIAPMLNAEVISLMGVIGSILIVGLSFNMLGITKLKVMNYVPAILLPILILPLWNLIGGAL